MDYMEQEDDCDDVSLLEEEGDKVSDDEGTDGMNDITLQCLLNAKNYRKVMEVKEPENYGDTFLKDMQKEKGKIMSQVEDIIDGKMVNSDMYVLFRSFVKCLHRTWELEKIQKETDNERERYEEEQVQKYAGSSGWSFWSSDRVVKRG